MLVTRAWALLFLLQLAVWPRVVAACTCVVGEGEVAWPTLEQAAASSDAVLIARIVKQVNLAEPSPYEGNDVAYVDAEIVDAIQGVRTGSTVRIWDAGFGTSCSVDLRPLRPGVVVAFALERNGTKYREYWDVMKLKVAPGDLLLRACGDYKRRLEAEGDIESVAAKLREAVRRGRRTRS